MLKFVRPEPLRDSAARPNRFFCSVPQSRCGFTRGTLNVHRAYGGYYGQRTCRPEAEPVIHWLERMMARPGSRNCCMCVQCFFVFSGADSGAGWRPACGLLGAAFGSPTSSIVFGPRVQICAPADGSATIRSRPVVALTACSPFPVSNRLCRRWQKDALISQGTAANLERSDEQTGPERYLPRW